LTSSGRLTAIAAAILLCCEVAWGQSAPVPEVAIGGPAPEFSAIDEHGQRRRLSDYRGSYLVLEWTNRACPFVKKHYDSDNMQSLQNDSRARGVVWLTVTSTAPGHPGYMDAGGAERFRNRYDATPTSILLDPDGRMGRQYDVEVTPTIFIIDADGVLVYMGGMDDKPTTRVADVGKATDHVGTALDEALAGRAVSRPVTRAYGCPIDY
jgi:peroxiredoxin